MRPFGGKQLSVKKRIFNYRLSRGRRYVECAFGILSSKWKILHRPLNVSLHLAINIVKVCCVLLNFVRERDGINSENILTRTGLDELEYPTNVRAGPAAIDIRNEFADFLMSEEGALSW